MTALLGLAPVAQLVPLLLPSWLDPEVIIKAFGPYALWGVAFIIFAECGLFAVLPGDSLLFTVGIFTGIGTIDHSMVFVCAVLTVCAIAGNACGYAIGRAVGPPLFKPRRGLAGKIFNPTYVEKTRLFYDRYGNRALILARFVPIIRTFVTFSAGVTRMPFRRFILYTGIGGLIWAPGVTVLGYFLGNVTFIRTHIDAVLVLIVVVSLIPMGIEYLMSRRHRPAGPAPADEPSPPEAELSRDPR
ncbi:membrane-associated protein [Friedmanniella endophytica]|uniref:Membrane-associated protein n=1 Tax=Microlunatus kandeliicorticis TaxID=1759536 RepID=A0A7W3P4I1_9ACTN|nr:DedA family protein [Microlunatus kandeliicorticis]MBA8792943.1 membrane-associated protein [Microlunatus kandeliicorticis]